jgi:hypothetical protein
MQKPADTSAGFFVLALTTGAFTLASAERES